MTATLCIYEKSAHSGTTMLTRQHGNFDGSRVFCWTRGQHRWILVVDPAGEASTRRALKGVTSLGRILGARATWNSPLGSVGEKKHDTEAWEERPAARSRRTYLEQHILETYGSKVNGPGCEFSGAQLEICRKRIEKEMVDAVEGMI